MRTASIRRRLLVAVAVAAVMASAPAAAAPSSSAAAAAPSASPAAGPPEVLGVTYVHRHPLGAAGARPALVVRAQDPDGQIVSVRAEIRDRTQHADGGCDLGGKRAGEVERWVLPVRPLSPGRHRVTLGVESSPCDGEIAAGEATTRVVTVTVGARRPAGDPPGAAGPGAPQPPPAWAAVGARSTWLAFGSYCWARLAPDGSGTALCADTAPPETRRDLPVLELERGRTLRIQLGFDPVEAVLLLDGRHTVRLDPARRLTWKVAGRFSTLTLLTRPRTGGDASYVARARVR